MISNCIDIWGGGGQSSDRGGLAYKSQQKLKVSHNLNCSNPLSEFININTKGKEEGGELGSRTLVQTDIFRIVPKSNICPFEPSNFILIETVDT